MSNQNFLRVSPSSNLAGHRMGSHSENGNFDQEEIVEYNTVVKKTKEILNEITPENINKLVNEFTKLNLEDKDNRIAAAIFAIYEKAIEDPILSAACAYMLRSLCAEFQLTANKFRKHMLNRCQTEFQNGSDSNTEEIKALEEILATAEEVRRDELKLLLADKKYVSRRRRFGNVCLIGELYRVRILTENIIIDCIEILLENSDEESYEALCKLLSTIGERLDDKLNEMERKTANRNPQIRIMFTPPEKYMENTFAKLITLSADLKLSGRTRFALLDVVKLRKSGWKSCRDADVEVHRDLIRQQEQEKIKMYNLPAQRLQIRPNILHRKKMNDWGMVTSNISSSFVIKKPAGVSSGGESTAGPMLAPNRGGSWNTPGSRAPTPSTTYAFIPPRLKNQGRFGMLYQEDKALPSTPLRENIVQAPPPPLRPHGSRSMQGVDETVLQNGDEVIEEEEDEDGEFVDEGALDSVEDGEINDETSEEPEELGKKKRIQNDPDTLLGFKTVASKDALPDMNSIPPEVIKDSKSSSSQNHFRGSPSPNLPLRMGSYNTGNRNIRNDRVPQMLTVMGRSIGGMGMMIPPPPTRQPKVVIELNPEKVELHKAEKAWKPTPVKSRTRGAREEDKDEEEIVKDDIVKKTRGILNKLTPENFDKLVIAFLELNLEDKDDRIAAVIFVVFEKAINEPSFSTAYANMVKTVCDKSQLSAKKFRKNILDQCQKEFQKGSNLEEEIRALEETLAAAEEDKKEELKLKLTDKKYASRRRSLGNVRFIGELYKLQMLTPKIMIDCIGILLTNNDEESYESLCKLLSTIGQRLDNQLKELELRAQAASRNPQTPVKFIPPEKYMDKTFAKLKTLSVDQKLSSRIRFPLLDVVELRESGWKPRRGADGPKKIVDVHRDAIRQQEQEKIQINNLPAQGPQMRQNIQPQKKMNDWSTVPSNKSSRFVVKKPTGVSSGGESTAGPMLAPNRGGSWNTPGSGASMPPKPNNFIPPRLQNQGRFGILSQEDRAPPSAPLRENIVQASPPPLRPHGSRPQTPTRDQPLKPDPVLAFTLTQPPPPHKDAHPVNIPESVKYIFEKYLSTNNSDDMLYHVRQKFAGEKVTEFVDELSRQVSEMSKEIHQKNAGSLIKGLIREGLINKAQVTQVFTDGVMIELPDIQLDVPKVTSYLGVFLVELFLDEPDLSWLVPLGVGVEEDNSTVWTDLVTTTLNFLKLRLSKEAVQILYKKTQCADRLPVQVKEMACSKD